MRILLFLFLTLFSLYAQDSQCLECHKEHTQNFARSHHALAMQEANETTVLGDFNDSTFDYNGIISAFYKKDGAFMVRTDGEDGKLHDYNVAFTFGVYPLQQYMVKFPKGKVQVLDIAWDSRSKDEGGQRWFHIHQDDNVTADDVLHWSGVNLNWNFMCADCHSTNLRKNYDPKTKSFNTLYDNITLTCTSCHGDTDEHLQWAKNPQEFKGKNPLGLPISLKKNRWNIGADGKAKLDVKINRTEVMMCAQCHSRRAQIAEGYKPGKKFEDHYIPSMLEESLYFSNGAIKDEVYEYGSFTQSKMYDAGVTCSDCHDVHSLNRATLNSNVCNKCHQESKYTATAHTHHAQDAKNVNCITCHMPSRTYMGVDERNDHSFSLPRPDLSIGSDNPNACNQCHKDKNAQWATDAMVKWYGNVPQGHQNYSHAFTALRANSSQAPQFLYDVLMSNAPTIVKATVVEYLGNYPSQQTYTTTLQMLHSSEPSVRLQALVSLEQFPLQTRIKQTFKMLDDPIRTVRMEAARQLSALPSGDLDSKLKSQLKTAIDEYRQSLLYTADRAESQVALGGLYLNLGEEQKAVEAYEEALRIQPRFIPAILNYVHYLQTHNDEAKALSILQAGLKELPNEAPLHYSLGLWHIRAKQYDKALILLEKAHTLDPDDAQLAYVYAVAIAEKDPKKAITILEGSISRHSGDLQALQALAYYFKTLGDESKAKEYQQRADEISRVQVTPIQ